MKIIVGLGNVGKGYEKTLHNMGFLAVDKIAEKFNEECTKKECDSVTAHFNYKGEKVIIAKPTTLMNLSGRAVQSLIHYYKCDISDIIVLYDDIDIEKGTLRFRQSGSAGTHNGMRDIIACIGSGEFARVRLGVGRPPAGRDLASYVLGNMLPSEVPMYSELFDSAVDKVVEWLDSKR